MKKCGDCGSPVTTRIDNVKYSECGLDNVYLIGIQVRRCLGCKGTELVIPRIDELHRVLARSVARRAGRLNEKEIRFLRKYLGYSSAEAAAALGVKPETMSRWENGRQPMEMPTERLLRLMIFHQDPVDLYPADELLAQTEKRRGGGALRLKDGNGGWRSTLAS